MAIKYGILIISDRAYRGEREDKTAQGLEEIMASIGGTPEVVEVAPDDIHLIVSKLKELCDDKGLDLIITSGGTGIGPRDVTPEATKEVIEKAVPGFSEYIRMESAGIVMSSLLSRAVAGVRGRTFILNLPGSPKGARESLEMVVGLIPHALEQIRGEEGAGSGMHGRE